MEQTETFLHLNPKMENDMAKVFSINGKELLAKIEELIKEGNARRIIIKDALGKTFIEIPVTIGLISAVIVPTFTAVGAITALVTNFTIEVITKEDEEK